MKTERQQIRCCSITGAEVDLMEVTDTNADAAAAYDALALGCPAMGDEELEDGDFEPFFSELEGKLSGKKLVLFGSYDWGDGEWMRLWEDEARDAGATLVVDSVMANNEPDDDAVEACKALGAALA